MRALVFFPHNPFPPRSGAHQRCLQIVGGLRDLNIEVVLASSSFTSETAWDVISESDYRAAGSPELRIHHSSRWDAPYLKVASKYYRWTRTAPLLSSPYHSPLSLQRWFAQLYSEIKPELVLINYAFWDNVVTREMHQRSLCVMDTLDLVTLYQRRFNVLRRMLPSSPLSPDSINPELLRENFFEQFDLSVSPEEFRIYDKYAVTIAITPSDARLIRENTQRTRVVVVPMTFEVDESPKRYTGDAIFPTGPNPFNVQGYLFFAKRVLPIVREQIPDFQLTVTGGVCDQVDAVPGVRLRGFVPDLNALYTTARFLICPILGKTGQQIKILEAMAHSIPVVALRASADGSPIRHEENGLIADDAAEFAAHVVRLWHDPELCRRFGNAARATIAQDYSNARLRQGLCEILEQHTARAHVAGHR